MSLFSYPKSTRPLTPNQLPTPPLRRRLPHPRQPQLHQHAQARKAPPAQGVPRRLRDEPHAIDDAAERDEVERDGGGDGRADEAEAEGRRAPDEEVVEEGVDGRDADDDAGGDVEEAYKKGDKYAFCKGQRSRKSTL